MLLLAACAGRSPQHTCLHCKVSSSHCFSIDGYPLLLCDQAMSESSCNATAYGAGSNAVEEYAEAMTIFVYDMDVKSPSLDTSCLQPQLDAMHTYSQQITDTYLQRLAGRK